MNTVGAKQRYTPPQGYRLLASPLPSQQTA